MSDASPLIVPIEVEALVVGDPVRDGGFQRWTYEYRELAEFASAEPAPFGAVDADFTAAGGTVIEGNVTASEYYNGIYLKWRLPAALRRGKQESGAGRTHFPKVPNRWLVVRDGEAAWLVESDHRCDPATPTRYGETGSAFLDEQGNPITIGRTIPLTTSGWTEPGSPTFLTAVGPGNLGFSGYQPACNNVFSFVDSLAGTAPYEYLVLGWHSDPADDPLHGVEPKDFGAAMEKLGWQLPLGTDPAATAGSVVYCGTLSGVPAPATVSAGGAPATDEVSVAVAPSAARALATLVAQQAGADHKFVEPELLEALVLDLVRAYDQPEGPAEVEMATFAAGFRSLDGGSCWVLTPGGAAGSSSPALTAAQIKALAALNEAQAEADAAERKLADLRRRLYELWFKYELLPAKTHITPAELKPRLEPAVAGSLARATKEAAEDCEKKAETVEALAKAAREASAGYELKQVNREPFFQAGEPVVMLSKAGAPEIADPGANLVCRLVTQLVGGYVTAGGERVTPSSPGVRIPQPVTGALSGAPWPAELLEQLIAEDYFLANLPSQASPIGVEPSAGRTAWTRQPWRPLYLMWEGAYFPIAHDTAGSENWSFANGRYTWNGEGGAAADAGVPLAGRLLLTPQASMTVGARLQTLLETTPDLSTEERDALEELKAYVQSKDDWDLLSQALDGFTDQLLKRTTGAFASPALSSLATTPSLAALIDGGIGNPPDPRDDGFFQAWRSGQFRFTSLAVVDEWGQTVFVAGRSDYQLLVLHRPEEMLPDPVSVLKPQPDPVVQLSPALLQPARLNFDLISAADGTVLGPAAEGSPICGWVLPNHLDRALVAFDAGGVAIGELAVGIGEKNAAIVVWRPAPGSKYPTWTAVTAIPHLGPMLELLRSGSAPDFEALLAAIDETLWTTTPAGAAFDPELAVLAGRPLALVRASLGLELEGEPIADPSWQYTDAPAPTPAPGWPYAVELGDLANLGDGLVGYFAGDDYESLYVVAGAGVAAGGYLKQIGSGDGLIELSFDPTTVAQVSMLVDPRAAVHATSGILPVTSVSLPPALVSDALAQIDLSFRVGPILAEAEPSAAGPTLLLPAPAGNGAWAWVDAGSSGGERTPVAPPGTRARLTDAPPAIRSGLLDLKSAFAPHRPPKKGRAA
jgi:hypothetical protein